MKVLRSLINMFILLDLLTIVQLHDIIFCKRFSLQLFHNILVN